MLEHNLPNIAIGRHIIMCRLDIVQVKSAIDDWRHLIGVEMVAMGGPKGTNQTCFVLN